MTEQSSKPSKRLFGIEAFKGARRLGGNLGLRLRCRCHRVSGAAGGLRLFPLVGEKMGFFRVHAAQWPRSGRSSDVSTRGLGGSTTHSITYHA